jgi:hypothetical protein
MRRPSRSNGTFVQVASIAISGVLMANAAWAEPKIVGDGKPIDFFFIKGQKDVHVPFSVGNTCTAVFLEHPGALVIDRVIADRRDVVAQNTKGFIDGPPRMTLRSPGRSFRYTVLIDDLHTGGPESPFVGRSFPIPADSLPQSIEVHYRIRCADGKVSEPMVTRGVRLYDIPATDRKDRQKTEQPSPAPKDKGVPGGAVKALGH